MRSRRPRQVGLAAVIALAGVAIALAADWVVRDRALSAARADFSSAHAQLTALVRARTARVVAQADALFRLPPLEEVAWRDLADFGLADPGEDRARLARVHDALRATDWLVLARPRAGEQLAIGDFKARVLYASANPAVAGTPLTGVPVLAAAYASHAEAHVGVLAGDDRAVVASGVLGDKPHAGLYLVVARARRIGEEARALYVQLSPATDLVDDITVAEDTQVELVAPGAVAPAFDGMVERRALRADDQSEPVADIVLAREVDAELFPHARPVLLALALVLAVLAVGLLAIGRSKQPPA